jgi:S-(hydroxymethyl)mycothiol dehydrogenase
VVVAVQACGVCHTDLHYREGGINDEFPFLLGHEAAGTVELVGEGVTDVAPGDYVVLNWRAVCGQCRACARGELQYCFDTHNATQKMTLQDGTVLSPALGIGAFADKTLVAAGQCTKVDENADPAAAGPHRLRRDGRLGRRGQHRTGQEGSRSPSSAAAASGTPPIAGAVFAGATTVIAVDRDDRKLEWAQGFGATHTVNATSRTSSRGSRSSPAGSAPTSSSRRSADPRPTGRPSRPATSPGPWCSSASRRPR